MAKVMKDARWRLAVNAASFLGVMLVTRNDLFPDDVVALFMDLMNDPHPQMRSTAQSRMTLVALFSAF
jgi:radical SAM superfamily enzyme